MNVSTRLYKLNTVILVVFSNWLCSVTDSYTLDTLPLCLLADCAHKAQRRRRSVTNLVAALG